MRLVGRAVGVDDQVQLGTGDFQIAQQDARAPEIQDAQPDAQVFHLGVRRLAGSFKAVQNQPARIGFKIGQMPVKGADLGAPAGGRFQLTRKAPPDQVFKSNRTGPEIKAQESERQQH